MSAKDVEAKHDPEFSLASVFSRVVFSLGDEIMARFGIPIHLHSKERGNISMQREITYTAALMHDPH